MAERGQAGKHDAARDGASVNCINVAVEAPRVFHMKSYSVPKARHASALAPRGFLPGQTMAEFAYIATALLLAIFAIFNFGIAIYSYSMVTYAANDAVRWASVNGATAPSPAGSSQVLAHVLAAIPTLSYTEAIAQCPTNTTSGALEVCAQWQGGASPGEIVQVQVQYNFALAVPFMSRMTLPLTATSQMAISQ